MGYQYPILKGVAPSWAEVKATANIDGGQSLPNIDWKALNWESKVDRGDGQRGPTGRKRKRVTGKKTDTGSATLYQSGLKDLKRALMAVAPKDDAGRAQLSKVPFDLVIKYSMDEAPEEITVIKLMGCTLDKDAGKTDDGSVDPITVDIDLNPMEIIEVIDDQETVLL